MQLSHDYSKSYFAILILTVIAAVVFDVEKASHFWNIDYGTIEMANLIFICLISFLGDYIVLEFHSTTDQHPKFMRGPFVRLNLFFHVLAGNLLKNELFGQVFLN